MKKRKPTKKQLENLAKGQEIHFQNQLKKRGINLSMPSRNVTRESMRQPATNNMTQFKPNVQLSLFNKFMGLKFFPIEINNKKENLNITELLNYIFSRLDIHRKNIHSNNVKIDQITNYLDSRDEKYVNTINAMNTEILQLKEENAELKEQIKVIYENATKDEV
ncbi:hypothetical protein [Methanohalophilus portucalensis]|uniref:Uncharacterized protein n=3 Tax=Methanohalophilus portucalensis TaxID=39664 RepID=A0A1X7N0K7_9EURY|nr:hypothetical protein [Methanohalophilus portucalensis]ATU08787.1 hypothetical protein BKM01_08395 [Methanohalophilus portucalensis]RNI13035.1 hypothetical protein EFE41_00110 [Methanohalophilus portucalensis FDF-1]SMH30767.1 hypothetical protein SAMN06264941_0366 [Methanohalophilus portucalensis FDF-1]